MTETTKNSQYFFGLLMEVIETNLQNSQFGVNELANKMGMARSSLHRKVIKATNSLVSQFISQVKLKHANELIKQTTLNVVLESGEALVGSMVHNGFPFTFLLNLPIYATNPDRLKESWYILQEQGAKRI